MAARLLQPSTTKASLKVENKRHQKKRHRRGHNSFDAIVVAASLCRGVRGSIRTATTY
jgi:hypothetical protein